MGLPSRSFAADAHHCIMVQVRTGPTEYKGVARMSAPDGELPSDDLGHRKACGYVDDRLRRPSPLPPLPEQARKAGKCSPSPTYPQAPQQTREIDINGNIRRGSAGGPKRSTSNHLTPKAPYKPAPAKAGDDLQLRPIYHQLEHRIEAHIFVAFIAYCLHVTLKARLRPLAPGLTPRAVLDKLAAIQMLDVHLPTTDGRTLILTRYTEPNPDHKLIFQQLNLTLPPQPPPRITAPSPPEPHLLV